MRLAVRLLFMGQIRFWRSADFEVSRGIDMGHEYPKHWHDESLLCVIDRGGGELFYRGSWHATPVGSVFLVPAGEIHANRGFCNHHNLYVRDESIGGWRSPVGGGERGQVATGVVELCRSIAQCGTTLEQDSHWLDLRTELRSGGATPRVGRESGAVSRVREYLLERYAENVSLDSLAKLARLSPFHLHRAFRKECGMPPHVFQIQARLSRARALLRDGVPAVRVAVETGFTDQSHLHRHFRRVFGMAPGEYGTKAQDRTRPAGGGSHRITTC